MKLSRTDSQRGVAAVEVGLVLPLLLLTIYGIVEFGTAYYRQQVLTGAVRDAARAGVIGMGTKPSSSQIKQKVFTYLDGVGWDSSQATVTVTGAQGASGTSLTVEATYPTSLSLVAAFADSVEVDGNGNIQVGARVVMEIE